MVSVFHQEIKTIEFIQCLINFAETSQGRANCVRKLCLHSDVLGTSQDVNFKHDAKHITGALFSILLTKFIA